VLSLATARQSANSDLSDFHLVDLSVTIHAKTARCRAACCRDVTLPLSLNRSIGLKTKQQGDIAESNDSATFEVLR
jgi:hypothetical protein